MEISLLKLAVLPLKIISLIMLAIFSRIFFEMSKDKEDGKKAEVITFSLVLTRTIMGTLIFLSIFKAIQHFFNFDSDFELMISTLASFASKEFLDVFITVPSALKDKIFNWFQVKIDNKNK